MYGIQPMLANVTAHMPAVWQWHHSIRHPASYLESFNQTPADNRTMSNKGWIGTADLMVELCCARSLNSLWYLCQCLVGSSLLMYGVMLQRYMHAISHPYIPSLLPDRLQPIVCLHFAAMMQERDDSEQLVRELMRKTKKLQEDQAAAEVSLKVPARTAVPDHTFTAEHTDTPAHSFSTSLSLF